MDTHKESLEHSASSGLCAEGLGKSYFKRDIIKNISLHVKRGEIVGLLGPNGAGKTTFFYMITGLIKADSGRITLDGDDITFLPMYQRARLGIGYLPQESSIFRGLNVWNNIMGVVELHERDKKKQKEITEGLLEELHIMHIAKSSSLSLSGGERRRVEIARALASRPSFMLLDEPFTGIDPLAIADISGLIRFLKNRGIGILITDHQVRETLDIVDRASILYDGDLLFEGSPKDVLSNEAVRRVYLGDRFMN